MPLDIPVSSEFRKNASRSILSIALFFCVFILLVLAALGFAIGCGYLGVLMIVASPAFFTLLIGAGMVAMGLLVAYSVLKFVGARYAPDRSGLLEISREQQPGLFAVIDEVVKEVETSAPKRVFLASDVNAAVFYDSSFRSMFMPVKKNLQIGLGLINSVTVAECKAILAHEFGHFSQRSMKVGSYVYHVNQALYNLLYDTEGYEKLAHGVARLHWILALFARVANWIVQGIHGILRRMYQFVNARYSALSREMEFHADEVAAHVAGSKAMSDALIRLGFVDQTYNDVIRFFNDRIPQAIVSGNVYAQQRLLMQFWAEQNKMPLREGIPQVSGDSLARYRRSKLVVVNQWASHPATEERVSRLEKMNIILPLREDGPSSGLFRDIESLERAVTADLFAAVPYDKECTSMDAQAFMEEYIREFRSNKFDDLYNDYYDLRNLAIFDLDAPLTEVQTYRIHPSEFFGQAMVDKVYTLNAMRQDLSDIRQIWAGRTSIRTFDYDGIKYTHQEAASLITRLENEVWQIEQQLAVNDIHAYRYFLLKAAASGQEDTLKDHYRLLFEADGDWDRQIKLYSDIRSAMQFMFEATPVEAIEAKLHALKPFEAALKVELESLLAKNQAAPFLTDDMQAVFKEFLGKERVYFFSPDYFEHEVNQLLATTEMYQQAVSRRFFSLKKRLLDFQAGLEHAQGLPAN
jgi:Zn-dependent protease with chaperone function